MKYIDDMINKYIILGYFEKNKDKFIKLGYEKSLAWVRIRMIALSLIIITALIMLTACTADPQGLRQPKVHIEIVDPIEGLIMANTPIDMPVNHANEGN